MHESKRKNDPEQDEEDTTFEELGLDSRLISGLNRKAAHKPTPIQRSSIPLIIEGKDILIRAKIGSGKKLAYALPLLHKLIHQSSSKNKNSPTAVILAPTRDLCQQVYSEVSSLVELCGVQLKPALITSSMTVSEMHGVMKSGIDILVSTPACISKSLADAEEQASSFGDSVSIVVIDEADLMLSYGYEMDLKDLRVRVSGDCQCLLISATSSVDTEKLKELILHRPLVLTLSEPLDSETDTISGSTQQFSICCGRHDKLLHILSLLKLDLVHKKVLIFTNTVSSAYRLRLFLEKFAITSCILNPEVPRDSRVCAVEKFNAGLFDFLIAADGGAPAAVPVVKGINFRSIRTVMNLEMPAEPKRYVDRIPSGGGTENVASYISLVCPEETGLLDELRGSMVISPFPLLAPGAVESLRYRAEDMGKSVTKVAIRDARMVDLRTEILNSQKLKAHFEANPADLNMLKAELAFRKQQQPPRLRAAPDYLIDAVTRQAITAVRDSRAAMGIPWTEFRSSSKKKRKKRSVVHEKKSRKRNERCD